MCSLSSLLLLSDVFPQSSVILSKYSPPSTVCGLLFEVTMRKVISKVIHFHLLRSIRGNRPKKKTASKYDVCVIKWSITVKIMKVRMKN